MTLLRIAIRDRFIILTPCYSCGVALHCCLVLLFGYDKQKTLITLSTTLHKLILKQE